MTHVKTAGFFFIFSGLLIAAVITHRNQLKTVNTCENVWCGEKNAEFYDVSEFFTKRSIEYKHIAYASHVINFGVLGAGVPIELFFTRWCDKSFAYPSLEVSNVLLMYLLSFGMVYSITLLFKSTIPRQRPAAFFNMTNVTELGSKNPADEWESFFSGDSAIAVHAAVFFILFSKGVRASWRWIGGVLFLCSAFTGMFLRVVALMHWSSDVLVGGAVGLLVATFARACFSFPADASRSDGGYLAFHVVLN